MISIQPQNQWDSQWRFDKLSADGKRTLGSDGCAMSCLAMFVGVTPRDALMRMRAVGGVADSGDLNWYQAVHKAFPEVFFHFRWSTVIEDRNSAYRKQVSAAYDDICILLALGQPVIVKTTHPNGGPHFVIAKEILPDDLLINDPDGGREIKFSSRFGKPRETIQAYVVLIKQVTGLADNVTPEMKETIRQQTALSLPKAQMIEYGVNVQTYTHELIDSFI